MVGRARLRGACGLLATTVALAAAAPLASAQGADAGFTATWGCTLEVTFGVAPETVSAQHTWDFGDGTVGAGPSPVHTYADRGTYTVTHAVTNPNDQRAEGQRDLVLDLAGCPPRLGPMPVVSVAAGHLTVFCVSATSPDGSAMTVAPLDARGVDGLPLGATYLQDSGCVRWIPRPGQEGRYCVPFTAMTPGGRDTACASVAVLLPPAAPDIVADMDGDGIPDVADSCPAVPNHDQADVDGDGRGDACFPPACPASCQTALAPPAQPADPPARPAPDRDHDGIEDVADNCPAVPNHDQANLDRDLEGDACDADIDGDGIPQAAPAGAYLDNCPFTPNPGQQDTFGGPAGDACETPPGAVPATLDTGVGAAPLPSAPQQSLAAAGLALVFPAMLGAWWLLRRHPWIGLVPLFTRLKDAEVLDNATRSRIRDEVANSPGIHFEELARRLGRRNGVLRHHLMVLERSHLIESRRWHGMVGYYLAGTAHAAPAPVLRSRSARRVYEAAALEPSRPVAEIASELGLARATVSYHIMRLREAGVLPVPAVPSAVPQPHAGHAPMVIEAAEPRA